MKILDILLIAIILDDVKCAKILGIFPNSPKSHFMMFEAIMKGLAERGHEVIVIAPFPQKTSIPRYKDISTPELGRITNVTILEVLEINTFFQQLHHYFNYSGINVCENMIRTDIFQNLYKTNDTYDLIITEFFSTDCFLILTYKYNVPVIGVTSTMHVNWMSNRFGVIDNPAFIPNIWDSTYEKYDVTTLYDRVWNTLVLIFTKWLYYYYQKLTDVVIETHLEKGLPSIYELSKNVNLLLVNSHFSFYDARSFPPNVIEVGGIHLSYSEKLPEKIEKLLNSSEKGVILFSLGTILSSESLDLDKQRAFIDSFGSLPYTVIWKANANNLTGPFPNNIYFESWIPQKEILCHPNTKLFITHCGLMGTQEAIYCGVPMIGIPIAFDQNFNIYKYVKKGIAIKLDYEFITKETVMNALNTVLQNSSYRENSKKMSTIFRDRPISAMDNAMYWIEYVLRYDGAEHLRPSNANQPWYEIYLVDVACILIVLLLILNCIFIYLIYYYWYTQSKQTVEKIKSC